MEIDYDTAAEYISKYYKKLFDDKSTILVYEDYEHLQYVISPKNTLVDISYNEIYERNNYLKQTAEIKYINKEYIRVNHFQEIIFSYTTKIKHRGYVNVSYTKKYAFYFYRLTHDEIKKHISIMLSELPKRSYEKIIKIIEKDKFSLTLHNLLSKIYDISTNNKIRIYETTTPKFNDNQYIEIPIIKQTITTEQHYNFIKKINKKATK